MFSLIIHTVLTNSYWNILMKDMMMAGYLLWFNNTIITKAITFLALLKMFRFNILQNKYKLK